MNPDTLAFTKCHGYGNDFLVVAEGAWNRAAARLGKGTAGALCARQTGVGADGVVLWTPPEADGGPFGFRIVNADGSEAGMSGNGLRSLAAMLCSDFSEAGRTFAPGDVLAFRTGAGPRRITLRERRGGAFLFLLEMGRPSFSAADIPMRPDLAGTAEGRAVFLGPAPGGWAPPGCPGVTVTALSVGNPNAVVRLDTFDGLPLDTVGPWIENHPAFPERINVEFVRVTERHRLEARFWERGAGPTRASGTGSASAAAAALEMGWVESPVRVAMEGGEITVSQAEDGSLLQEGWAQAVFRGEVRLDALT